MSGVIHTLPWVGLRQGRAEPRKHRRGWRSPRLRELSQEHVREIREMGKRGFLYPEIAEAWGLSTNYVRHLLFGGLRDDEREDRE